MSLRKVISSRSYIPALVSLVAGLVFFLTYAQFEQAGFNDGDSITHYQISRYSWRHPVLFLHHWGKPFFTLISSPFAQAGFFGIQVFNIICGLFSCWSGYLIARRLHLPYAWLVIPFTWFAPVFMGNLATGLTEILFALVLTVSVLLSLDKKYILSAALVSFLPFCRSEGYLILPLFGLFFILTRQWRAIPFLAAGSVIYTIIGGIFLGDFLWLANQNPYHEVEVYGSGPWIHFLDNTKILAGLPLTVAFVTGFLWLIFVGVRKKDRPSFSEHYLAEALLIFGSCLVYFAAHSIFWWQGIFGSLGMLRVIAGIIPLFAIASLRGLTALLERLPIRPKFYWLPVVFFTYFVIYTPISVLTLPLKMDPKLRTMKVACDFVERQNLQSRFLYYSHPFIGVQLDKDPFDTNSCRMLDARIASNLPTTIIPGSLVIWENRLGPNECSTPIEKLKTSTVLHLEKSLIEQPVHTNDSAQLAQVHIFTRFNYGFAGKQK